MAHRELWDEIQSIIGQWKSGGEGTILEENAPSGY